MPEPPAAAEPAGHRRRAGRRRRPSWSTVVIVLALLVAAVVVVGARIRLPYTTLSPGSAVSLTELVRVDGPGAYPDGRGDIRLLFVRERNHVNVWEYLRARLDDNVELFPDDEVNPAGVPLPDLGAESKAQMAESRNAATILALRAAGYDVEPRSDGVEVLAALPSMPAGDVLESGDVILEVDGVPITPDTNIRDLLATHRAGDTVRLGIVRKGEPKTVDVGVELRDDRPSIGVIVSRRYDFPVKVDVDTQGIGGPSGGLAMTLAILDDLTPGNLTGGQKVAVTGTIDPDGNVGEIGGIEQKAVAARASGVDLLIVPACVEQRSPDVDACRRDVDAARARAGSKVRVRPVATFEEALQVLRENGGDPVEVRPPLQPAA